jgi:L-threonylcarbamoyladenylate synthase
MNITLEEAIDLLKRGEVIAIPTDTVYGLAADMQNRTAVDKIFEIKRRPNDKPLITLCSQPDQVDPFVKDYPPGFDQLAGRFWPGALTLVIPIKPDTILDNVRCGGSTEGFRIPNHPLTLELIDRYGSLVAPSANLSSYPSARSAAEVEHYFGTAFPILDGGPCSGGVESTILCFQEGSWRSVRVGAISLKQLEELLSYPILPMSR